AVVLGHSLPSVKLTRSILEAAPRESPRHRGERPLHTSGRGEHRRNDGEPPVKLEFSGILAGLASWPWKPQDQGIIDRLKRRIGCGPLGNSPPRRAIRENFLPNSLPARQSPDSDAP